MGGGLSEPREVKVSDFVLVVEDRLSDLRRGLYAGVVSTDDARCIRQPQLFGRQ